MRFRTLPGQIGVHNTTPGWHDTHGSPTSPSPRNCFAFQPLDEHQTVSLQITRLNEALTLFLCSDAKHGSAILLPLRAAITGYIDALDGLLHPVAMRARRQARRPPTGPTDVRLEPRAHLALIVAPGGKLRYLLDLRERKAQFLGRSDAAQQIKRVRVVHAVPASAAYRPVELYPSYRRIRTSGWKISWCPKSMSTWRRMARCASLLLHLWVANCAVRSCAQQRLHGSESGCGSTYS